MSTPAAVPIPAFVARGLTRTYRMGEVEVQALKGVDLELARGEFVVILGPSGSGKSTLLNLLGALDVPTAGSLVFQDHDLTVIDDAARTAYRRDHVGFVFQFYNLLPALTAAENVAVVADIAHDAMEPAVARAIVKRPEVLLCDEPTGALDAKTGIVVLEALAHVSAELGSTTILITHNAGIAAMADRVLMMSNGQIVSAQVNETRCNPRSLHW